MDIAAVLGASWALSSEITVDGLQRRLLQMVVQTGARTAAVFTPNEGLMVLGEASPPALEALLREVSETSQPAAQDHGQSRSLLLPLIWQNNSIGAMAADYPAGVPIAPDVQSLLHYLSTQAAICWPQLRERERLQRAVLGGTGAERHEAVGVENRLVSGFAHMIRNALTSTTFCFEAIRLTLDETSSGAEETREALSAGKRGVDRALRAAGRISELAHVGRAGPNPPAAGLGRGIQTVLFRQGQRLREHSVAVQVQVPNGVSLAMADSDLQPLLLNLIDNACDALIAQAGSEPRTIDITADADARWVTLQIADVGHGIDAETRKRLFEPFFTTRGSDGTGLGLVLCKKIVETHGGALELLQNQPRGCRVVLRLPRASDPTASSK